MKILVVTAFLPYASVDHAGGKVSYALLSSLCLDHDITLISFLRSQEESKHVVDLENLGVKVRTLYSRRSFARKVLDRLSIFTFIPLRCVLHRSSDMAAEIQRSVNEMDFDLVQIEYTQMAIYSRLLSSLPKVLLKFDIQFDVMRQRLRLCRNWFSRLLLSWEFWKLKRWEMAVCMNFDHILCASKHDADLLQSCLPGADISFMKPYVQPAVDFITEENAEARSVAYLGGFMNPRNVYAMNYFFDEIWPLILKEIPDAVMYVIGSSPPPRAWSYMKGRVHVTGFVDDPRKHLAKALVFVAPMRIAGGIMVKILEAMSVGKPVVTTTLGAKGIGALPGKELLIADEPVRFAEAVVRLLVDKKYRREIACAGLEFIKREYNWKRSFRHVDELYKEIASNRGSFSHSAAREKKKERS